MAGHILIEVILANAVSGFLQIGDVALDGDQCRDSGPARVIVRCRLRRRGLLSRAQARPSRVRRSASRAPLAGIVFADRAACPGTRRRPWSRYGRLRDRAARSARRVEDFKEQKIVGASGELVTEQQLSTLNKQLMQVRAATAERRARYEDVRRLQRGSTEPDAIAEAIESPTITALRSQYAEAKQAEANKTAILGPRHPQVIAAAAQVVQSRRRIDEELSRIAKRHSATTTGHAPAKKKSSVRSTRSRAMCTKTNSATGSIART